MPDVDEFGIKILNKLRRKTHGTIERVDEALESMKFNSTVASLMEFMNAIADFDGEWSKFKQAPIAFDDASNFVMKEALSSLALMLTPFAPHAAEELYSVVAGNDNGIIANDARFPEFSAELAKTDEIEIPVQINGKLRVKIMVSPDITDDALRETVMADEKVQEYVAGKEIAKIVVVPKRLVSIVIKG